MLCSTVLFDASLKPILGKENLLYNSLIRFLRDISKTGVILVDQEQELVRRFLSAIQSWEDVEEFIEGGQCTSELHRLLIFLEKENRFVARSLDADFDLTCKTNPCAQYLSIAKQNNPDFVITNQECSICADNELSSPKTQVLKIDFFDHDEKFRSFADRRGFRLRGWNQENFEHEILIPLFRYTENVFMFDKQLGMYFHTNPGYEFTIRWLLEIYLQNSVPSRRGVFEVHIKESRKPDSIEEFETRLQNIYPKFKVVTNSYSEHARFLRTDQVEVCLDRGFDLILNRAKSYPRPIRDVYIGYSDGFVEPAS